MPSLIKKWLIISLATLCTGLNIQAQKNNKTPQEDDYYRIFTMQLPEDVLLEVGGLTTLPDGGIAVCTRRGDVWTIENPYITFGRTPHFVLFASGLHEPLGLVYKDGALYCAQRGELTKLIDKNGDGKADIYETIYAWPLSGYGHEYSYGPKFAPDGSMFVTGNAAFGEQEGWRSESRAPWRGWTMHIFPDGTMDPWATGMRSPCGIGVIDGELFYTDNQGDWVGSGGVWHLKKGSFTGNPAGLRWTNLPGSPVKLTEDAFFAKFDKRQVKKDGRFVQPQNIKDEKNPTLQFKAKEVFPEIQMPAVWLPHGILGVSNSEIVQDKTGGKFGPFEGQLLVGDQGQSKIMRVVMEKVKGEYQGVAFDFKAGFQSGVLRMTWGNDGSMFVGETNRGWGSAGTRTSGLERLVWTGKVPMEMKTVRAMQDGFEIEFTRPVDKKTAEDLNTYSGKSYIYKYHPVYGSPPINDEALKIKGVKVSDDGRTVRLVIDNLRQHYLHEINVTGIRDKDSGLAVLHPTAYYTLHNVPEGEKLLISELSTKRTVVPKKRTKAGQININNPVAKNTIKEMNSKEINASTYEKISPLLVKNTCTSCHAPDRRQVGPAFVEIAKRKYSNKKIVELIYNPQPQNWPDHETPMPPMPQVPKDEALKIAAWINSLQK